jgi:hypothetical protein
MAVDIEALKKAASGSEGDKIAWYASQLRAGYTDAQIRDAVNNALGTTYTGAEEDWKYLQDKAAEDVIKQVVAGTAADKATAYNQLYQGAGLSNDIIQQNIAEVLGEQDPEDIRALLGIAGAQRAAALPTAQGKADYVKEMVGYDYTPEEIINYINTGVGPQTDTDMAELFRLADVQMPSKAVDTVKAAGGADTVVAGGGADTVVAGGGADTVVAGGGADTVRAAGGADTVVAAGGADTVKAAGGNDTVSATTTWTSPTGITIQVPAGWEDFTGQQKVDWFKSKNMTGSTLQALGIPAKDIAGAVSLGLPSGASANFDTTVRGAPTTDRSGTGVAITGESGLREGYAPYVQRLLERASAEADVPFQKYTGESPLLESAKQGIANLTTPAQFLQGSNLAQAAGIGALNYGQYKPTAFTTGTFANPVPKAYGGEVEGYDAGGTVDVGGDTTNPYTVPANPNIQPVNYGGQNVTNVQASYMSPYMQNVVDVQQREAKRQADIANQAIGAKAVQAGAFGGSRHGLLESEADRNLLTQLGGIQAKGLQEAYTQGLGQFNVEQNRGLEAQKMGEQSRQFGAELGLKGLQTGIQSAQVLGNLGQQQGQFDLASLKQMADLGTADRNFDYNEFLRAEKYPYENLTFMKNMLSGLPISAAATGIDPLSQALTGGISTVALIDMLNKIGTGSTGPTTTGTKP